MSSVELKSIVKKYGEVTAVASIDLSVESGEFVTLLGPSGCGKNNHSSNGCGVHSANFRNFVHW